MNNSSNHTCNKYNPVANDKRHELIRLIYEDKISIRQAALRIGISYPTAKAINRIYRNEDRVDKKAVRQRRSKLGTAKTVVTDADTSTVQPLSELPQNNEPLHGKNPKSLADKIRAFG